MKSLKIIQTVTQIAKGICGLIAVLYIISIALAGIGLAETFFLEGGEIAQFGELTVNGILSYDENYSKTQSGVILSCYIVVGIAELLALLLIKRYLVHELDAGTPFTFDGAKELFWVGVKLSVLLVVAMGVSFAIYSTVLGQITMEGVESGRLFSIDSAVWMIFLSVVFRYGAEVREANSK